MGGVKTVYAMRIGSSPNSNPEGQKTQFKEAIFVSGIPEHLIRERMKDALNGRVPLAGWGEEFAVKTVSDGDKEVEIRLTCLNGVKGITNAEKLAAVDHVCVTADRILKALNNEKTYARMELLRSEGSLDDFIILRGEPNRY